MNSPALYRGPWPQNVSKLAKYAVRFIDGGWKVTVFYLVGEGCRYLAVESGGDDVVEAVNAVKTALSDQPGGAFYVNEFRHLLVPVADESGSGAGSRYYCAGRLAADFTFEYEGEQLTTRPIRPDGSQLRPSDRWIGPRPGIPYVLAAGGSDVYFETPALTDGDSPEIRPLVRQRVHLSKVLGDRSAAARAAKPVADLRGHQGGRFYVNEHGAMFTPISAGDGNGIDYLYCGQINRATWFPEPVIAS